MDIQGRVPAVRWAQVPVDARLHEDLVALASCHRMSLGEYCAKALKSHAYGHLGDAEKHAEPPLLDRFDGER